MENRISVLKAAVIFIGSTAYFFILLYTVLPFLKANFFINPALYWFITGYFLFIPLFILAIAMVKGEGNNGTRQVVSALNIRPFSKKDLAYSTIGLVLVFALTGFIFAVSFIMTKYFNVRPLATTPWFMEMRPFQGPEKLFLLIWLPMFFFNIVGEELLWRGYIQARLRGKYLWLLCSALWMLFHVPFGFDLMIMLVPALIIIPYVFDKTKNSLTGIFIHGLYNGPVFILVALGFIK